MSGGTDFLSLSNTSKRDSFPLAGSGASSIDTTTSLPSSKSRGSSGVSALLANLALTCVIMSYSFPADGWPAVPHIALPPLEDAQTVPVSTKPTTATLFSRRVHPKSYLLGQEYASMV